MSLFNLVAALVSGITSTCDSEMPNEYTAPCGMQSFLALNFFVQLEGRTPPEKNATALDITVIVDVCSTGSTAAGIWHDLVFIRFRTARRSAGTHIGYIGLHGGELAIAVGGIRLAGIFCLNLVT